ncbi:MAG TPA: cyclic nucleotide-binding domain-containing protein [Paludibaculum sp.]|jgi:CRP-like cAMP-binding protein
MNSGAPDLLRGLSPQEVGQVLALGTRMQVPSGSEVFGLGSPAGSVYVIERGLIRLTLPMQVRGRDEDILVEERTAGQTVGWSALIPPYRFTLKATAPVETEVIALSRDALQAHFDANPGAAYSIALNLAAVIGQRLQLFQAMWLREMQRLVELRCV